jgi:hypothetical protein
MDGYSRSPAIYSARAKRPVVSGLIRQRVDGVDNCAPAHAELGPATLS